MIDKELATHQSHLNSMIVPPLEADMTLERTAERWASR